MTGDPSARSGHRTLAIAVGLIVAVGGVIAVVVVSSGAGGSMARDPTAGSAPMPSYPRSRGPMVEPIDTEDGRIYECAELEDAHRNAERADALAFHAALVAQRLELITLDARHLGPFTDYSAPQLRREIPPWTEVTDKIGGKPRAVLLGEAIDLPFGEPAPPELVVDTAGDVRLVQRAPALSPRRSVQVRACAWGCWGQPPSGVAYPPAYHRARWLLPPGRHYRGVITIPYTTPGLIVNVADQHCSPPA